MSRRLTARLCLLLLYWPFRNVVKSGLQDNFFISCIFKPGLLFSFSTWTRPTFDHSEVKIGLYRTIKNEISLGNAYELLPIMFNRKTDRKEIHLLLYIYSRYNYKSLMEMHIVVRENLNVKNMCF